MRTRVLFALVLMAALPIVVNAQAPGCGSGPVSYVPTTPAYMSGTVIGGPMYASTPMYGGNYTVVERTGPLGLMRWRTIEPATTVMPAMTASAVVPAAATIPMPATGGYFGSPMPGEGYTVVERTGPLGLMRWRTLEPATTVMPAPMTPMPTATVMPASATTSPMPTTTTTGIVTGGYVVPPTTTTTVMPAAYTWTGPLGRQYYSRPMSMDGTTYYTAPGSVMPASYATPATTGTYVYPAYSSYPAYNSGRYFNFMGFGFGWR